ncbi:MAG: glycosyltransferase family 4 protein [Phycisphaerales bacterium]|nr:glycosyltransferase family 4 protein [Phycisphaerales bacterium]
MRIVLVGKNADHVLAYRGSLIRAAQARGHEVHAITGPSRLGTAPARLAEVGVPLHVVRFDGGGANPIRDALSLRALTRTMRRLHPDAVLCYNPKSIAYGPIAARAAGVRRVVAMVTGLGYAFTGSGLRRRLVRLASTRLYRRAFARCDVVFLQNPDDRDLLRELGCLPPPAQVRLLPGSGVDLERFTEQPLPLRTRFLMIARLLRDKGVPEFVAAARQVHVTHPAAEFALIGGPDPNPTAVPAVEIERWRRAGVPELVDEVEDVRPHLAACTVFVLPSHREGTSKVMLEAMATGRAVITTDAPGCREPVEPGVNGLLVAVGDSEALAETMRRLADDRAQVERMGREGRRIAETRYDARVVDAEVMAALEGC